jgi:hypothetical protein
MECGAFEVHTKIYQILSKRQKFIQSLLYIDETLLRFTNSGTNNLTSKEISLTQTSSI